MLVTNTDGFVSPMVVVCAPHNHITDAVVQAVVVHCIELSSQAMLSFWHDVTDTFGLYQHCKGSAASVSVTTRNVNGHEIVHEIIHEIVHEILVRYSGKWRAFFYASSFCKLHTSMAMEVQDFKV